MRSVPRRQDVGSVPQTSCEIHLHTRPLACLFRDAEMQSSAGIRPGVIAIVQIVQSPAIARNRANFPIVSAEMKRLCGRELGFANALYNRHRDDTTTLLA